MATRPALSTVVLTPESLLAHWQGHRRLTRRVIEAFPADQLFTFSVGEMRSFGELALEMLAMAGPMVRGIVTGEWAAYAVSEVTSRDALLRLWDDNTEELDALWPQIAPERFQEMINAFGQYEARGNDLLLYAIDNEVHHRGQGYVYLRALGIEPPPFYARD